MDGAEGRLGDWPRSLQFRLSLSLTLAAVLVAVAAGAISYRHAVKEVGAMQDAQMADVAKWVSMLERARFAADSAPAPKTDGIFSSALSIPDSDPLGVPPSALPLPPSFGQAGPSPAPALSGEGERAIGGLKLAPGMGPAVLADRPAAPWAVEEGAEPAAWASGPGSAPFQERLEASGAETSAPTRALPAAPALGAFAPSAGLGRDGSDGARLTPGAGSERGAGSTGRAASQAALAGEAASAGEPKGMGAGFAAPSDGGADRAGAVVEIGEAGGDNEGGRSGESPDGLGESPAPERQGAPSWENSAREPTLYLASLDSPDVDRVFEYPEATLALQALGEGFSDVVINHRRWRALVFEPEAGSARYVVAQPMAYRESLARNVSLSGAAPWFALLPALWALVALLTRRTFAGLRRQAEIIRSRGAGDLTRFSLMGAAPEVKSYIVAVNELLDRLSRAFSNYRRFIADAAHELRTPVTALSLQIDALSDPGLGEDERLRRVAELKRGAKRTQNLLQQLLTLARVQGQMEVTGAGETDAAALLGVVMGELLPQAEAKGIDLGVERLDAAKLAYSEAALRAIFKNLIENAIRYTPQGGRIDVSLALGPSSEPQLGAAAPGLEASGRESGSKGLGRDRESGPASRAGQSPIESDAKSGRGGRSRGASRAASPKRGRGRAGAPKRGNGGFNRRQGKAGRKAAAPLGPNAAQAVFCVKDTGPGIPQEEIAEVLKPFSRRLGAKTEGSGLGLAIVNEICARMGASLSFGEAGIGTDTINPGLAVTVSFPSKPPAEAEEREGAQDARRAARAYAQFARREGREGRGE